MQAILGGREYSANTALTVARAAHKFLFGGQIQFG